MRDRRSWIREGLERQLKIETDFILSNGYAQLFNNEEWVTRLVKTYAAKTNPGCQVDITCPNLDLACACVHLLTKLFRDDIDFELTERGPSTQLEFKNGSVIVFAIGDPKE